jgi:TRAP-type mannitol/chloroaromatic compound transport system permease small subunit
MLAKFSSCVDKTNEVVGKALYPVLILICVVVLIEIIARSIFVRPTLWSFETTQFLFAICTLLAGGHLHRENGHINVDIFYSKFSPKWKAITDILTFPFFLLFIGSMAYFGFQFGWESVLKRETTGSAWDPPVYPIKITVFLGAGLLLLQGLVKLIRDIDLIRGK